MLAVGCAGGSGEVLPLGHSPDEAVRGVWTAEIGGRVQRRIFAHLTIENGVISGSLGLVDGDTTYSGPITGTNGERVRFSASLEGYDAFTFENTAAVELGHELVGSFRFRDGDQGTVRFHRELLGSFSVAGGWISTWSSKVNSDRGTFAFTLTQRQGFIIEGTGVWTAGGVDQAGTIRGTLSGPLLSFGLIVDGKAVRACSGMLTQTNTVLAYDATYSTHAPDDHGPVTAFLTAPG